ncbi:disease resistance protein [Trifolium pratense]|uniref:Disease resistance protein n=1 Tax=Trifolium pratense TaxID=57577 RepID=A0A2K3M964_TRIPR|nr:disease resistance protein [Trifolium pratense]
MAVAVVGEAFLSAFIEVVLDRLTSPQVVNLIRGKKFDVNLVQGLNNTLYVVEAVLNDAEQKARNSSKTLLLTNGLMTSKMLSMLLMTFWIISLLKLLLLGTKRR